MSGTGSTSSSFKHITPLVFSESTRDESPNISPREVNNNKQDTGGSDDDDGSSVDEVMFKDDKKMVSKIEKFNYSNKGFRDFIIHLRRTVLEKKPERVLDFLVDEYFSGDSLIQLTIVFGQKR